MSIIYRIQYFYISYFYFNNLNINSIRYLYGHLLLEVSDKTNRRESDLKWCCSALCIKGNLNYGKSILHHKHNFHSPERNSYDSQYIKSSFVSTVYNWNYILRIDLSKDLNNQYRIDMSHYEEMFLPYIQHRNPLLDKNLQHKHNFHFTSRSFQNTQNIYPLKCTSCTSLYKIGTYKDQNYSSHTSKYNYYFKKYI